jgi:1-acyl-sn-glycerol-3-phosphate acyltransferase
MNRPHSEFEATAFLRFRRKLLRVIVKSLIRLLFRLQITGRENIPASSSYVIAYNHVSLFEPAFILAFWPVFPEALAGHDVWQRGGLQGIMVKFFGAIPVKRGEYDRKSVEMMLSVLRSGKPLAISPEGGRSHAIGMRKAHAGISYLVDQADVPVLPVAIEGTNDNSLKDALSGKRPRVMMRIGEPLRLPPISGKGAERREARQRNADEVMKRLGALLPKEYHGVYTGLIEE